MNMRHKICGSSLRADVSHLFTVQTPSVNIGTSGISLGPLEISEVSDRSRKLKFSCHNCSQESVPVEEMEISCDVCRKFSSVKNTNVVRNVGCMCSNCVAVLSGEKEPVNEKQKYTLQFFKITSSTEVVPLLSVLDKSVSSM